MLAPHNSRLIPYFMREMLLRKIAISVDALTLSRWRGHVNPPFAKHDHSAAQANWQPRKTTVNSHSSRDQYTTGLAMNPTRKQYLSAVRTVVIKLGTQVLS